ncbi:hypothetical protein [Streptomyces sp. NPDC000983]|uniref:hypothetical protein n=1 Tax=Streptomyces sp. NPDC000983 TaxID=3154373 RepID=UPI00331AD4C7
MTADRLRKPGERARTADTAGREQGPRPRTEHRPGTTVLVVPLWERLGGGTRG